MANDHDPMARLIRRARQALDDKGLDGVTDRELNAALFGWLAETLRPTNSRPIIGSRTGIGSLIAAFGMGVAYFGRAMGWW